jgi:hypothetical protein
MWEWDRDEGIFGLQVLYSLISVDSDDSTQRTCSCHVEYRTAINRVGFPKASIRTNHLNHFQNGTARGI